MSTTQAEQGGAAVAGAGVAVSSEQEGWRRSRVKKPARWALLRGFAWLCTVPAAGLVGLALVWRDDLSVKAGGGGEWFVIASHAVFMTRVFWFHLGVAFVVAAVFAMVARGWWLMMVAGLFAGVTLAPVALEGLPRSVAKVMSDETSLTVMSVNLMYGATDAKVTLAEIARIDPDVVVFQEWTPKAEEGLAAAMKVTHRHQVTVTREDAFGQAVFSRRAFVEPARQFPGGGGRVDPSAPARKDGGYGWSEPQIRVVVDAGEGSGKVLPVVIYDVHVLPPVGLSYIDTQRRQVLALSEIARAEVRGVRGNGAAVNGAAAAVGSGAAAGGGASAAQGSSAVGVIFVGDFNATANTADLGVMHGAGMRDAVEAAGEGWTTTWPRTSWLRYLPGIRLDHVLASDGLRAVSAGTGADNGSDHRPVWVKFAVGGKGSM